MNFNELTTKTTELFAKCCASLIVIDFIAANSGGKNKKIQFLATFEIEISSRGNKIQHDPSFIYVI